MQCELPGEGDEQGGWPPALSELAPEGGRSRPPRLLRNLLLVVLVLVLAAAGGELLDQFRSSHVPAATRRAERFVVDVNCVFGLEHIISAGTGIVLTAGGKVVTNNHVVDGATSISVTDVANGRSYRATVLGDDAASDVALLQLRGAARLPVARLAPSARLVAGEEVIALGNANGEGGKPAVAEGRVLALGRSIVATDAEGISEHLSDMIESNEVLEPGDSGGPLVDSSGRVVGMDTASAKNYLSPKVARSYAVPMARVLGSVRLIEQKKASEAVHIGPSAYLGVEIALDRSGATVVEVLASSPAARAGISVGDEITALGGHRVTTAAALLDRLRLYHPGNRVFVSWLGLSGEREGAWVVLGKGPAD